MRLALHLEVELSMEVLGIGRSSSDAAGTCVFEAAGKWLMYRVALHDDGRARLSAIPMDSGDEPDLLLRVADSTDGWETLRRLISALEQHEIKSLCRPIEAGEPGTSDC
jgi:hypothetical protein